MSEQTYDDGRARNLEEILRALAERIRELDEQGRLLANASELTKLLGEARSELFHYEVRATYDTPEVADNRRIVNDAIQQAEQGNTWQSTEWTEDGDDAPEWGSRRGAADRDVASGSRSDWPSCSVSP
jgi:hypothetical protein